jgi:hypothetical protein
MLILFGRMNSSRRISPGGMGSSNIFLAILISSVVVDDLDVVRISVGPAEADPPPVVDPDAVLSPPVARQDFETVSRGRLEVAETARPVEIIQLPARHPLDRGEAKDRAVLKEGPCVLGCE